MTLGGGIDPGQKLVPLLQSRQDFSTTPQNNRPKLNRDRNP